MGTSTGFGASPHTAASTTSDSTQYTKNEMMAHRASAHLRDEDLVFVGIGLPNLACNLARETHAPNLFMIYESGAVGTQPERLPISIGDPTLVTGSLAIVSQADIFQNFLQGGRIEVGFLGGAQIDRWGNINTTVIGNYADPKVRLPGSGGACEIATHAKRLLVVMRLSPQTFVEKVDFITSPGHRFHSKSKSPQEGLARDLPGSGPVRIITDLCEFGLVGDKLTVDVLYPGVTREQVSEQCGWDVAFASSVGWVEAPPEKSLKIMREKLDPERLYLK